MQKNISEATVYGCYRGEEYVVKAIHISTLGSTEKSDHVVSVVVFLRSRPLDNRGGYHLFKKSNGLFAKTDKISLITWLTRRKKVVYESVKKKLCLVTCTRKETVCAWSILRFLWVQ